LGRARPHIPDCCAIWALGFGHSLLLDLFAIMAVLDALPADTGLEFSEAKELISATDGNPGTHTETLTKAGYISVEKAFVGKKPQIATAKAAGCGVFARQAALCVRSLRRGRVRSSLRGTNGWSCYIIDVHKVFVLILPSPQVS